MLANHQVSTGAEDKGHTLKKGNISLRGVLVRFGHSVSAHTPCDTVGIPQDMVQSQPSATTNYAMLNTHADQLAATSQFQATPRKQGDDGRGPERK